MAKKKLKNLSSSKLEERIAPAMVGGVLDGAVDAASATEAPVEATADVPPGDAYAPAVDVAADAPPVPGGDDGLGFGVPDAAPYQELPQGAEVVPGGGMDFTPTEGSATYDFTSQAMTFDTDAANAIMPDYLQMSPDGGLNMALPPDAQFDTQAGTLGVPNFATDQFLPGNIDITPTGDVNVALQPGMSVDPDAGLLKIEAGAAGDYLPPGVTPAPDGGVDFTPPPGAQFNPETNQMTVPADETGSMVPRASRIAPWRAPAIARRAASSQT